MNRPDLDCVRGRIVTVIEGFPTVKGLSLFGSRARGDFREDSDWDMLAVVDGGSRDDQMFDLWRLEKVLAEDLGAPVQIHIAEDHDVRWRRRIAPDVRLIWGEPIRWGHVEPMTREEAEQDRLAYQMEYVHHVFTVVTEGCRRAPKNEETRMHLLSFQLSGPVNTLRIVQRHRPDLYSERFADLIPDAAELLDELELSPSDELIGRLMRDVVPEVRERAGGLLDELGVERPSMTWDNGLHPPDGEEPPRDRESARAADLRRSCGRTSVRDGGEKEAVRTRCEASACRNALVLAGFVESAPGIAGVPPNPMLRNAWTASRPRRPDGGSGGM